MVVVAVKLFCAFSKEKVKDIKEFTVLSMFCNYVSLHFVPASVKALFQMRKFLSDNLLFQILIGVPFSDGIAVWYCYSSSYESTVLITFMTRALISGHNPMAIKMT